MGNFSIKLIVFVSGFLSTKLLQKVLDESSNLALRKEFTDFVISRHIAKTRIYAES
jgi:hypothetical protein